MLQENAKTFLPHVNVALHRRADLLPLQLVPSALDPLLAYCDFGYLWPSVVVITNSLVL